MNKKLFSSLKELVYDKYKNFRVVAEGDQIFIRGNLVIEDNLGKEIDHFLIEIKILNNYPATVPEVREIGGRLAKVTSRHFNEFNSTACLFLPEQRYKYWPRGSNIIDFIEGPVKKFFIWQIDYNCNKGNSNFDEWPHGVDGIIDFYTKELNTNNIKIILKFLEYLVAKKVKKSWPCYCQSGKSLLSCHLKKLNEFKNKILRTDAKYSLGYVRAFLKIEHKNRN